MLIIISHIDQPNRRRRRNRRRQRAQIGDGALQVGRLLTADDGTMVDVDNFQVEFFFQFVI